MLKTCRCDELSCREPLDDMQIKWPEQGGILIAGRLLLLSTTCWSGPQQALFKRLALCRRKEGYYFEWEWYFRSGNTADSPTPLWRLTLCCTPSSLCQHSTKVKRLMRRPLCAWVCTLAVFTFPCLCCLSEKVWGRVGDGSPWEQIQLQNGNQKTVWITSVTVSGWSTATAYWL